MATRLALTFCASPSGGGGVGGMARSITSASFSLSTICTCSRQTWSPIRSIAMRRIGRAFRWTPGVPAGTRSHRPRRSDDQAGVVRGQRTAGQADALAGAAADADLAMVKGNTGVFAIGKRQLHPDPLRARI